GVASSRSTPGFRSATEEGEVVVQRTADAARIDRVAVIGVDVPVALVEVEESVATGEAVGGVEAIRVGCVVVRDDAAALGVGGVVLVVRDASGSLDVTAHVERLAEFERDVVRIGAAARGRAAAAQQEAGAGDTGDRSLRDFHGLSSSFPSGRLPADTGGRPPRYTI